MDVTRDFVEPAAAVGYSADHHKIGSVSGGPKSFPFLLVRSFVPPRQAQHPLIYVLTYPGYLCFMSSLERQLLLLLWYVIMVRWTDGRNILNS